MSDNVSREAVLEALREAYGCRHANTCDAAGVIMRCHRCRNVDGMTEVIRALPAAPGERGDAVSRAGAANILLALASELVEDGYTEVVDAAVRAEAAIRALPAAPGERGAPIVAQPAGDMFADVVADREPGERCRSHSVTAGGAHRCVHPAGHGLHDNPRHGLTWNTAAGFTDCDGERCYDCRPAPEACATCGGKREVPTRCTDPQHDDSTWDHDCGDGAMPLPGLPARRGVPVSAVERLRALLAEATPGPWRHVIEYPFDGDVYAGEDHEVAHDVADADAALIAELRNQAAALLAVVDAAKASMDADDATDGDALRAAWIALRTALAALDGGAG